MGFATAFWSALQGEVSGAALLVYRRAGLQVLELESALAQTGAHDPQSGWQTPHAVRHALLCHWVAQSLLLVANHLLDADDEAEPATRGYLPRLVFEQAKALYIQVPDHLHRGFEALANPNYCPDVALPVELSPRLQPTDDAPPGYIRGLVAAAQALDAHADLRLRSLTDSPAANPHLLEQIQQAQAAARSRLRWGLAKAEESLTRRTRQAQAEALVDLWDALADLFLLGQLLALPALVPPASSGHGPEHHKHAKGRRISRAGVDRWMVSDPEAQRELRHTAFGEREIDAFWRVRNNHLSDRESDVLSSHAKERRYFVPT